MEGHIYTEGRITKDYPNNIKAQIAALDPNVTKIIHHIQSPGGDCYAAYNGFHELMKIGKPITSVIEGEAQSMATFLAVAPANEVFIMNPSTFMIHEPFFPDGVAGTVDELTTAKEELEQIRNAMAEAYAKKTGKTKEEMMALMKKTTRLDARGAEQWGFAKVVEPQRVAALGELINQFNEFKTEVMNIFKKRSPAAGPTAIDLPTKEGKTLHVESETEDLMNKPATVDGVPAEGSFILADGREIVCVGGVVKEVKQATMPQETELQKQLSALQGQLQALKTEQENKIKAEEEAKKAAAEKAAQEEQVKALEASKKQIEELQAKVNALESKPVGSSSKPDANASFTSRQIMFKTPEEKKAVMATRTFLADNFPQWESRYPNGKYSDGTSFYDYRSNGGPLAVSILETNFSYTWQGILTDDLFYKPSLSTPALSDIFSIDTGSKDKKRYNIIPVLNKILKPYTGCDQPVTGTTLNISDKYIQLKSFRMKEKWCQDDFTDRLTGTFNHLAQDWIKDGNQGFDPAGTPIDRIIMYSLKDSLRRDVFRRVMLADADSSSADWNQINGLLTTLIDQSGASNYCVYKYGSNLGTGTLAANTASAYLEGMYENSNILLKEYGIDSGKAVIGCTRSFWDNYYKTLVGVGAVTEQAYADYKRGLKTLEFRGIPLKPYGILDSFLADSTCPLYSTTRHIAWLTVPENHILGVENTPDLGAVKSWFSDDDNVRYYSSQMTFGVLGAMHCDLTTIAY